MSDPANHPFDEPAFNPAPNPARIPARILRAHADDLPQSRAQQPSSERELARQALILDVGQLLFARFGGKALTITSLSRALRMSPATFYRYFCDLDELLAAILRRHLKTLSEAIGAVPWDTPDRQKLQRAAYVAATRCGMGRHTDAHRLLLRDRHTLPADLAEEIEALHIGIGEALAGDNADLALPLLDTPYRPVTLIEPMLAALATAQTATRQPETTPKPPQPPKPARPKPPRAHPTKYLPEHVPEWLLAHTTFDQPRAGP